jgi:hypothetical protein
MKKKTAKKTPQKTQRTRPLARAARSRPRQQQMPAIAMTEMVDIMAAMRDLLVEIRDLLSIRDGASELEAIVMTEPKAEEDLE